MSPSSQRENGILVVLWECSCFAGNFFPGSLDTLFGVLVLAILLITVLGNLVVRNVKCKFPGVSPVPFSVHQFTGVQGSRGSCPGPYLSKLSNDTWQITSFSFSFFCLFRASPTAYGGSQARGRIRAATASLHHSHSNTRSEPRLQPAPRLTAMGDS